MTGFWPAVTERGVAGAIVYACIYMVEKLQYIIDVRTVGLNMANGNPLRKVQNIPVLYPTRIRVFFNTSMPNYKTGDVQGLTEVSSR